MKEKNKKPSKRFKRLRIFRNILVETRVDHILETYIGFVLVSALIIWVTEPGITRFLDALWYCYAVISTAGFGDVVVTTLLPKIISVLVTIYSTIVIALLTGVIVNYYTEILNRRREKTLEALIDKLERLPELPPEELEIIADQVKRFRGNN